MTIDEAKKNLNKMVNYNGTTDIYKLTACILRRNERGYFYRAEILDINHGSTVLYVGLPDISPVDERSETE